MSKRSHAMESFSRFVIATAGALALMGAVAWAFIAFDNSGCSGGIKCRSQTEMHQTHY
ncbi:MAG: hypothetical protein JF615_02880 [Asticcacaulis sp.]|nr:hypothetical protein [Asticcacaulis sp.]